MILSGGNIDPTLLIQVMRHGLTQAGRFLVVRTRVARPSRRADQAAAARGRGAREHRLGRAPPGGDGPADRPDRGRADARDARRGALRRAPAPPSPSAATWPSASARRAARASRKPLVFLKHKPSRRPARRARRAGGQRCSRTRGRGPPRTCSRPPSATSRSSRRSCRRRRARRAPACGRAGSSVAEQPELCSGFGDEAPRRGHGLVVAVERQRRGRGARGRLERELAKRTDPACTGTLQREINDIAAANEQEKACLSETQAASSRPRKRWRYDPQRRNSTTCPPRAAQPVMPPSSTGRASMPCAARIEAAIAARAPLSQIVTTGRSVGTSAPRHAQQPIRDVAAAGDVAARRARRARARRSARAPCSSSRSSSSRSTGSIRSGPAPST